jgi:L-fuculose-phosphate aldolase
MTENELRIDLVAKAKEMDVSGLNRGASGNLSVRCGDRMLITPSAVPYTQLTTEMIAAMPLEGEYGSWEGPLKPSTEWRFHLDLMRARPDIGAIVHTHAPWCTVLAIARKPIPAIHYMMAAFGGTEIPVCDYACYGRAVRACGQDDGGACRLPDGEPRDADCCRHADPCLLAGT